MLLRTHRVKIGETCTGNFELCRPCTLLGKRAWRRGLVPAGEGGGEPGVPGGEGRGVPWGESEPDGERENGRERFYFFLLGALKLSRRTLIYIVATLARRERNGDGSDNKKHQTFKKRKEIKHNKVKWKTQVRRDSQQQGSLAGPGQVDHEGQLTREGHWGREELLGNADTIGGSLNIKSGEGIVGAKGGLPRRRKGIESRGKMYAFHSLLWGTSWKKCAISRLQCTYLKESFLNQRQCVDRKTSPW